MRAYADTSVFGGVYDSEFAEASQRFFVEVDVGRLSLVTSAIVAEEIDPAPDDVRFLFDRYIEVAEIVEISDEAMELQKRYIKSGIVPQKSFADALHIAVASVTSCDLIVSWNFRHIVNFEKIPKYNAVNVLHGYREIGIYSPLEVINYDE